MLASIRTLTVLVTCGAGLGLAWPCGTYDSAAGGPRPWSVTLADGSRLTGVARLEGLDVQGALVSRASLAPAGVESIRVDPGGETVTVRGTAGDRITGTVLNETLPLDTALGHFDVPFEQVRAVSTDGTFHRPPAAFARLSAPDDHFSADDVYIDFEIDTASRRLAVGADLSRTYVPWGLTIATSVGTSYPAVDGFVVASQSKGFSCATKSPRWCGTLTLSFCEPGAPDRPATVQRFGLWVAAVAPNGTRLRALGSEGEVLAEIATTRSGSEFLGIESARPIASVEVIPNPAIDSNYTIDDVRFDFPRPLDAPSPAGLYTVTFASGDVLVARAITLEGSHVVLSGLRVGVEHLRVARDRILTIRFPGAFAWTEAETLGAGLGHTGCRRAPVPGCDGG